MPSHPKSGHCSFFFIVKQYQYSVTKQLEKTIIKQHDPYNQQTNLAYNTCSTQTPTVVSQQNKKQYVYCHIKNFLKPPILFSEESPSNQYICFKHQYQFYQITIIPNQPNFKLSNYPIIQTISSWFSVNVNSFVIIMCCLKFLQKNDIQVYRLQVYFDEFLSHCIIYNIQMPALITSCIRMHILILQLQTQAYLQLINQF
eukprot:TRINITY_DN1877_c0_g1_i10.p2 TRINITY_DN1877_c0_g1~~TRINITY_DN1877_c0_g1_i10.p2  ORF type:complete len:200 (+),score=-9.91 TRINITY_DN1877_c0_g1_i10:70-669(+)